MDNNRYEEEFGADNSKIMLKLFIYTIIVLVAVVAVFVYSLSDNTSESKQEILNTNVNTYNTVAVMIGDNSSGIHPEVIIKPNVKFLR